MKSASASVDMYGQRREGILALIHLEQVLLWNVREASLRRT